MDPIVIALIVVAVIVVALGVVIGVRRHRADDYRPSLDARDQLGGHSSDGLASATRHSDRSGSGAGPGF